MCFTLEIFAGWEQEHTLERISCGGKLILEEQKEGL